MKSLLILMAALMLSSAVFAQEKTEKTEKKMNHHMGKMHDKMQNCVMMENGKMMVMKGGQTMKMDQDMTLPNGTTVMTDGTVKMKDGTTKMLKDGECVYMNGKMGTMKKMKGDKMKM